MNPKFNQITLETLLYKADKTRLTDEELVILREQKIALWEETAFVSAIVLDCFIRISEAIEEGEDEWEDFVDFISEIRKTYIDLNGVFDRLIHHTIKAEEAHL